MSSNEGPHGNGRPVTTFTGDLNHTAERLQGYYDAVTTGQLEIQLVLAQENNRQAVEDYLRAITRCKIKVDHIITSTSSTLSAVDLASMRQLSSRLGQLRAEAVTSALEGRIIESVRATSAELAAIVGGAPSTAS